MLTSSSGSSQTSYGTPKQIVAQAQSSGVVLYVVPAGKKFQGYIYNSGSGQTVAVTPSGGSQVNIQLSNVNSNYTTSPAPLFTLVAGTTITSASTSQTNVIGVETDA